MQLCHYYTGIKLDRLLFLKQLFKNNLLHVSAECNKNDFTEYCNLTSKYSVHDCDSERLVKEKVWLFFQAQISLIDLL